MRVVRAQHEKVKFKSIQVGNLMLTLSLKYDLEHDFFSRTTLPKDRATCVETIFRRDIDRRLRMPSGLVHKYAPLS